MKQGIKLTFFSAVPKMISPCCRCFKSERAEMFYPPAFPPTLPLRSRSRNENTNGGFAFST